MHKSFDFTQLGGFPFNQDRLKRMQEAYSDIQQVLAKLIGDNVIISGVEVTGGIIEGTAGDGWVVVEGELLPFVGAAMQPWCRVVQLDEVLVFEDGQSKPVQISRYVTMGTGAGQFLFSSFGRIQALYDISKRIQPIYDLRYERIGTVNGTTPGYDLTFKNLLDGRVHVNGWIRPYSEELQTGIDVQVDGLTLNFYDQDAFGVAIWEDALTANYERTVTSICKVVTSQQELGLLSIQALNSPYAPETWRVKVFVSLILNII